MAWRNQEERTSILRWYTQASSIGLKELLQLPPELKNFILQVRSIVHWEQETPSTYTNDEVKDQVLHIIAESPEWLTLLQIHEGRKQLLRRVETSSTRFTMSQERNMMSYQPEANDYRVKVEQFAPAVFTFHLWQYINGEWRFLFEAPQIIALERLKGHSKLSSEDGYDYWRRATRTM